MAAAAAAEMEVIPPLAAGRLLPPLAVTGVALAAVVHKGLHSGAAQRSVCSAQLLPPPPPPPLAPMQRKLSPEWGGAERKHGEPGVGAPIFWPGGVGPATLEISTTWGSSVGLSQDPRVPLEALSLWGPPCPRRP